MSHFTVLVIGDNPEDQLAPFHEFECTGWDNQYIKDVDRTEEFLQEWEELRQEKGETFGLQEMLEYEGDESRTITSMDDCDTSDSGDHKYGYILLTPDKKDVVKVIRRTNAKTYDDQGRLISGSKWDWYQIGGRWTGYFKLKAGRDGALGDPSLVSSHRAEDDSADQLMVGDVDVDAMKDEKEQEARTFYRALADLMGGTIPKVERSWKSICDDPSIKDWDEKRKLYHDQEPVKSLQENLHKEDTPECLKYCFGLTLEDYSMTEDEYAENARNSALAPFAFIKDGIWYERGSMGWWGCVSDEKDNQTWNAEFTKMFLDLPANTLLTLVDCHI